MLLTVIFLSEALRVRVKLVALEALLFHITNASALLVL